MDWLAELRAQGEGEIAVLDAETVGARPEQALPGTVAEQRQISDRVVATGRSLGPLQVPLVPVHGDLVPSNCLVAADGLHVIDWERSVPSASPLAEIVVFLTFYVRRLPTRRRRRLTPVAAFRRAFLGEGWLARVTRMTWSRQLAALGLPLEAAEYLLLATLADLATGHEAAAHPRSAAWRRHWSELLTVYVSERVGRSRGSS